MNRPDKHAGDCMRIHPFVDITVSLPLFNNLFDSLEISLYRAPNLSSKIIISHKSLFGENGTWNADMSFDVHKVAFEYCFQLVCRFIISVEAASIDARSTPCK